MLKKNPGYKHIIYDDDQMFDFVKSNYDKDIFQYFERIKNIVSRADFWRYLILYKNGGVYLDIDSIIVKELDRIIDENDQALITAETNKDCFVQWALIFDKNHPILENTIKNLIENINKKRYKNDVLNFSVKPYWDAVNNSFIDNKLDFKWNMIDSNTNILFNIKNSNFRIYSVDYGNFINFKHKYNHLLRDRTKGSYEKEHWTTTQKISSVYE